MLLRDFVTACNGKLRPKLAYAAASLFIALALVGLLSTVSCAHTEPGLQREAALYLATSNTATSLQQILPYVPPPTNNLLEGVLAVGGALLALWATHLHRSLTELRNGKSGPPPPASPPAAPKG